MGSGRFLGADALAAVGSSYTLMTFLTSILMGLCMGSGAAISMQYGSGEQDRMRQSVFQSFVLIAGIALVLNVLVYLGLDGILWVLRVPEELHPLMKEYLRIIFWALRLPFCITTLQTCCAPSATRGAAAVLGCFGGAERRSGPYVRAGVHWGVQGAAGATRSRSSCPALASDCTLSKSSRSCARKRPTAGGTKRIWILS